MVSEPGYETVGSKDLTCEDWMVNTRTDADLSAAIQNALYTLLPQIRAEIREEFRTSSGPSNSGGNPPPVTIYTWLERFNKQKPRSFEKATAPVDAKNWISHMEKIFDVMGCEDAFKTRFTAYKFEGNALAWWKAYKQAKEEEKDIVIDGAIAESVVKPIKSKEEEPLKEIYVTNEVGRRAVNKPTKNKLTSERPAETDIRPPLASHSYIYPLGIAKDVLVDVVGYVYPMDFVILDIKEDEKRPLILGTPFLTTAKAVIKFDKGMITLKSRKSKISFHKIPESQCMIKKGIKNEIGPIAPIMTVKSLEVLRKFHWTILGGRFNQLSHVSSPLLSKPGEY
nr:zinc finger, CCHC-type, retrotransposon Gag domain protein [Tanacetum cinerariifolium]